jgi:hypothetical protein
MWKRVLVVLLVVPISSYTVFWASVFFFSAWDEAWRPAWSGDGIRAEVIVILPASVPGSFSTELIPFSSAKGFADENPRCTFLIPINRQSEVLDQLRASQKFASITLQVKQLSENKQEVLVEDMDRADDVQGTRYEALETQVKLKSYRYVGDRDAFGVAITSIVLSATVHLIVLG